MPQVAVLIAVLLLLAFGLWRAVNRSAHDNAGVARVSEDDTYRALANKDGIHPDVADAFEQEIRIRGADIRRKHDERRRSDIDRLPGFDADPS